MARIFISYRRVPPDQAIARFLYEYFTAQNHEVFIDEKSIPCGAFWGKEIRKQIEVAEYFIPLVSGTYGYTPSTLDEFVLAERSLAQGKLRRLLPVNIAFDGNAPGIIGDAISKIHCLKWRDVNDTKEIAEALADLLPRVHSPLRGLHPLESWDADFMPELGRHGDLDNCLKILETNTSGFVLIHGVSGAGKTSFIQAGLIPALGAQGCDIHLLGCDPVPTTQSLPKGDRVLIFCDQFEQHLIRAGRDHTASASLIQTLEKWHSVRDSARLVFCVRDEYFPTFEVMLGEIFDLCSRFALLPLAPPVAADVLGVLADSVQVKTDTAFVSELCSSILAEGLPSAVRPALLQLIVQHCRHQNVPLNRASWDAMNLNGRSLFETHISEAVLRYFRPDSSRVSAMRCLLALTAGEVKASPQTVSGIAGDQSLPLALTGRVLELASLAHARVVKSDTADQGELYFQLTHDLFAPAIHALYRHEERAAKSRVRTLVLTILVIFLGAALTGGGFAWWQRDQARLAGTAATKAESEARRAEAAANQLVLEAAQKAWGASRQAFDDSENPSPGVGFARLAEAIRYNHSLPDEQQYKAIAADACQWLLQAAPPEPLPVHEISLGEIVMDINFSPDGSQMTGCSGKVARVWNLGSAQQVGHDMSHDLPTSDAMFSPDGTWVLTRGESGIQIWESQTGKKVESPLNGQHLRCLAFSPNGEQMVAATDRTMQIYNLKSGHPAGPLVTILSIKSAEFSRDGSRLLTVSHSNWNGNDVKVWDREGKAQIGRTIWYDLPSDPKAMFTPDGSFVLSFGPDGIRVSDTSTGNQIGEPLKVDSWVMNQRFDHSGKFLWVATRKGVQVWDWAERRLFSEPLVFGKEGAGIVSGYFTADGRRLITSALREDTDIRGLVQVWDLDAGKPVGQPLRHDGLLGFNRCSADGRWIVTTLDGTVRIWEAGNGRKMNLLLRHDNSISAAAWGAAPDAHTIRTFAGTNTIHSWDTRNGHGTAVSFDHDGGVGRVQFSADGTRLVGQTPVIKGPPVLIFDAVSGNAVGPGLAPKGDLRSVNLSPDGKLAVSGDDEGHAQLWEVEIGKELEPILQHENAIVTNARFSPNGDRILTSLYFPGSTSEFALQLWDTKERTPIGRPLLWKDQQLVALDFSRDGLWIEAATQPELNTSSPRKLWRWRADSWTKPAQPLWESVYFTNADVHPNGKWLAAAQGRSGKIWDVASGHQIGGSIMQNSDTLQTSFSSDGRWLQTTSGYEMAVTEIVSEASSIPADRLTDALEAFAGWKIGANGQVTRVPMAERWETRSKILADPVAAREGGLLRWLFSTSYGRSLSPGSMTGTSAQIEREIDWALNARITPNEFAAARGKFSARNVARTVMEREARHARKCLLDDYYSLDPGHPLIHFALASLERDTAKREDYREHGMRHLPADALVCAKAAKLLLKQGDKDRATVAMGRALTLVAKNPQVLEIRRGLEQGIESAPAR